MEIAKEKWFEVKYDTKLDKMVIKKPKFNNKMLLKHIINKIRKHSFLLTICTALIIFSILNVVMIYGFFIILQNV